MSAFKLRFLRKGITIVSSITYDTSIGNGVGTDHLAVLPLRAGARRFYVNASTGNDSRNAIQAQVDTTPVATIQRAQAFITQGAGDQVLVAENTGPYAGFDNLSSMDGFSAVYPTVIQTYLPADPYNEAKIGHPVIRPTITWTGHFYIFFGGGASPQYTAIRGLDFSPSNISQQDINGFSNTTGMPDYFLFENNIVRYAGFYFNLNSALPRANGWVLRGNSLYGSWSAVDGDHTQGFYLSGMNYTLEDNIIYHAGWKLGALRSDFLVNGGLVNSTSSLEGIFRHPIYCQDRTLGISRRNLTIDNAADGGSYRGSITATENLSIDNPIGMGLGGGTEYDTVWPSGTPIGASYNVILGSAQIGGSFGGSSGWGIDTTNGTAATELHHNILARALDAFPANTAHAFSTKADFNLPSYGYWHDNVAYYWTNATHTLSTSGTYPAQAHLTTDRNVWDDAASGTNVNNASVTFPNAYTGDTLYTALGFTGIDAAARKQAFINYVIAHPEDHTVVRNALNLLWAGYGISHSI